MRRIITKAEVTPIGDNPRFLITNMTLPAEKVYETYTGRGNWKNSIKELKNALRWRPNVVSRVPAAIWKMRCRSRSRC